jgi:hypothetical protein
MLKQRRSPEQQTPPRHSSPSKQLPSVEQLRLALTHLRGLFFFGRAQTCPPPQHLPLQQETDGQHLPSQTTVPSQPSNDSGQQNSVSSMMGPFSPGASPKHSAQQSSPHISRQTPPAQQPVAQSWLQAPQWAASLAKLRQSPSALHCTKPFLQRQRPWRQRAPAQQLPFFLHFLPTFLQPAATSDEYRVRSAVNAPVATASTARRGPGKARPRTSASNRDASMIPFLEPRMARLSRMKNGPAPITDRAKRQAHHRAEPPTVNPRDGTDRMLG